MCSCYVAYCENSSYYTDMQTTGSSFTEWLEAGYPRPELCRHSWLDLSGIWEFSSDPQDIGIKDAWYRVQPFSEVSENKNSSETSPYPFKKKIRVPFPPGSSKSELAPEEELPADIVWYRRTVTTNELSDLFDQESETDLQLHFEAVDYRCDVWVNGEHLAQHTGGYSPFSVSIPSPDPASPITITLRAQDFSRNPSIPRGKQSWRGDCDGIWYHNIVGIWRDVWLEATPKCHVTQVMWNADLFKSTLNGEIVLSSSPSESSELSIEVTRGDKTFASQKVRPLGDRVAVNFTIDSLQVRTDWDSLAWSPVNPNLFDIRIVLVDNGQKDVVYSYAGFRDIRTRGDQIELNGSSVFLRGILDQGYWEDSYFTPPTVEDLKTDLLLAKDMGFNLVRIHQRSPDRRTLAWADYLGLLIWAECPSPYQFSKGTVLALTNEWMNLVCRDISHPCIIAWVPLNESWGVGQAEVDYNQQQFISALAALTRSLDSTRLVISNDGWEQIDSDIITLHDYGQSAIELEVNYLDKQSTMATITGSGPQARVTILDEDGYRGQPVMVSEFGGISMNSTPDQGWGYQQITSAEEFQAALAGQFLALYRSSSLAGVCYTQLTDTAQETNGLCNSDRKAKIPVDEIRKIVGNSAEHRKQIRPREITSLAMQSLQ